MSPVGSMRVETSKPWIALRAKSPTIVRKSPNPDTRPADAELFGLSDWGSLPAPQTTIHPPSEHTPAQAQKLGPAFLWTAPVTFPMMVAVVYLSSKLGLVSGEGLFAIIRRHYSRGFLF